MMSKLSKIEYVKELKPRYLKAKRTEKSQMLDELLAFTNYRRKYAIRILSAKTDLDIRGKIPRKKRKLTYESNVIVPLIKIWKILDYPCGKRLKVQVPEMISALKRCDELKLNPGIEIKLLKISARTIDRRLKREKEIQKVKHKRGFCTTKPGTLKSKIPVRKGCDWDENIPGYEEIDTVAHNGGDPAGEFIYSLNSTDIYSGWTETVAGLGKSQYTVIDLGFKGAIVPALPFAILGVDGDSGSEIINILLYKYCQANNIDFTRSRPYHANDGCHVEEKNWTHVRKLVGYGRMDTSELVIALNDLYRNELRLYMNFFQPHMKCVEKEYLGSKCKKKYEIKTPYQWLVESDKISDKKKKELTELYLSLNPVELKGMIDKKLSNISKLAKNIQGNIS